MKSTKSKLSPVEIIQDKLEQKIAEILKHETKTVRDSGKRCFGIGFDLQSLCNACGSNKQCGNMFKNRCTKEVRDDGQVQK